MSEKSHPKKSQQLGFVEKAISSGTEISDF